jgi:hypothetical protein
MDQLYNPASRLPGAGKFAVQLLQGFRDRRHSGFEIYGLDGVASIKFEIIVLWSAARMGRGSIFGAVRRRLPGTCLRTNSVNRHGHYFR